MKQYRHLFSLSVLLATLAIGSVAFADSVEISAVVPGCGDGVVSGTEQCDGGDVGSASCQSLGFGGGTLSCTSACTFNITTCAFMSVNLGQGVGRSVSGSLPALRNISIPNVGGMSVIDFDGDGKVSLVDFSIIAYWYGRSSPPDFVDFNHDGTVNLIDFSIMAYYWVS